MPISADAFVEMVTDVGLASSEELRALLERHSSRDTEIEASLIAEDLVQAGKVTPYQARRLLEGHPVEIGQYVILDKLAEGGMGQVFRARHRTMRRDVALKLIHQRRLESAGAVERFRREIKALAELSHPHVVTAYDAGEHNGAPYLVMEFVEGANLYQHVLQNGPLSVPTAIACLRQTAEGLAYIHDRGIVHRDVKPSNLLMDRAGNVKVLDLGLSRFAEWHAPGGGETSVELTADGEIMGTADFMAPEQFTNTSLADHRADLYSLGCTLHFLLTGAPPYRGRTSGEKLLAHREQPVPSLRDVRPEVPETLDAVFRRLIAKRPDDRFPSARSLLDALGRVSTAPDPAASPLETTQFWTPTAAAAPRRGRRALAAVAAILVLALLAIAMPVWLGNEESPAVLPRRDGPASGPEFGPPRDAQDTAARRIIERGGNVSVIQGTHFSTPIYETADLPPPPFRIYRANLAGQDVSAKDMELLAALPDLRWLDLARTSVDDSDLRHLARLSQLETLYLGDTTISDAGLEALRDAPSLKNLDLRGTRVTDEGLRILAQRHKLLSLLLGEGQITTDAGLVHLTSMTGLASLGLRGTAVTDEGMPILARCASLTWLDLGLTQVSDEGAEKLEKIEGLRDLLLDGTNVTDRTIEHFARRHVQVTR